MDRFTAAQGDQAPAAPAEATDAGLVLALSYPTTGTVTAEPGARLNWTTSPPADRSTAFRSDPAPESAVVVTYQVLGTVRSSRRSSWASTR